MGLKGMGKRMGDIALRLAMLGCGENCGGCWKCGNYGNLPARAPEGETENPREKEVPKPAKEGNYER